jgi:hypothetical protein
MPAPPPPVSPPPASAPPAPKAAPQPRATGRQPLDMAGFWMLLGLAVLFGANNVLIKLGNNGLQPVFFAAMRSLVAAGALLLWMRLRGISLRPDLWRGGVLIGLAAPSSCRKYAGG